jgi:dienelactone hydrolase
MVLRLQQLCFLIAILSGSSAAQSSLLWDHLPPGRFSAGFRYVEHLDTSRVWKDDVLASPTLAGLPHYRPIRISIWYPASGPGRMLHYRDYVSYPALRPAFRDFEGLLSTRDTGYLSSFTGGAELETKKLLGLQMGASLHAPVAHGRFPLVLYFMGLNDLSSSNVVLWEYLASQGFVVVSVPQLGATSSSVDLGLSQADIETQIRDMEEALSVAEKLPFVDSRRVVTVGHSIGGIAALLLAMRNPDTKGAVALDGSFGNSRFASLLLQSPFFRDESLNKPFLDLRRSVPEYDGTALEKLSFSDRYSLQFAGVEHGDFTTTPVIEALFRGNKEGRNAQTAEYPVRFYKLVCFIVSSFLSSATEGHVFDPDPFCDQHARSEVKPSKCSAMNGRPALQDIGRVVVRSGVKLALATYDSELTESRMNQLGYLLAANKRMGEALEVLAANVSRHPSSANAYDSLAENELAAGDVALAAQHYRQELTLLDSDTSLSAELRERLRGNAQQHVRQLSK